MSGRIYKTALLVGRFQIIHSGHADMIQTAVRLADRVLVLVGSSNESRTEKNPFSYAERKKMLLSIFPSLEVAPLPDIGVGNCPKWGEYVLDVCLDSFGTEPELFVSGNESRRDDWFDSERGEKIARLFIPKTIDVSASRMREYLLCGDRENFGRYISPALNGYCDFMKNVLAESKGKKNTSSI